MADPYSMPNALNPKTTGTATATMMATPPAVSAASRFAIRAIVRSISIILKSCFL
jgi:hypothetical protein